MVEVYAGLDVSDKSTHLCVVDGSGRVVWAGACATDPDAIVRTLKTRAAGLVRVHAENGAMLGVGEGIEGGRVVKPLRILHADLSGTRVLPV